MAEPYLGQIEIFGFRFAPRDWSFADGQRIPIQQNTALYALIGTRFGGDDRTFFQLPNLAGRFACGAGSGPGLTERYLGESFGESAVMLTESEMPRHNHILHEFISPPQGTQPGPTMGIGYDETGNLMPFTQPDGATIMYPPMIGAAGGSAPHENVQPYLGLNFSIALDGDFPQFP